MAREAQGNTCQEVTNPIYQGGQNSRAASGGGRAGAGHRCTGQGVGKGVAGISTLPGGNYVETPLVQLQLVTPLCNGEQLNLPLPSPPWNLAVKLRGPSLSPQDWLPLDQPPSRHPSGAPRHWPPKDFITSQMPRLLRAACQHVGPETKQGFLSISQLSFPST